VGKNYFRRFQGIVIKLVICKSHNFIFLRIPKNASTSLAAFFINNCCDKNDIYTYVGNARIGTQNVDSDVVSKYKKDHRIIHLTVNEIVNNGIVSPEFVRESDVIGVIRNPLERQLSLFFFLSKEFNLNNTSVSEFRRQFKYGKHISDPSNAITQSDYLKLGDNMIGRFWLYDNIDEELKSFLFDKNIKVREPLKRYKSNYRERRDSSLIDEYYDDLTREAVEQYYAEDFKIYRHMIGES